MAPQRPRTASSVSSRSASPRPSITRQRAESSASSRSASPRPPITRPRRPVAPESWRALRRGLARAGRTQRWPAAADAAQLDRCCRAQATELGADAEALASLPRAAALRWPSLKKDLASRAEAAKATFARRSAVVAAREEARREQALRGRRRKNKAKPAAKDLSQKEGYLSKKAEKSKKGEKKKGEKAKGEEKKADDEDNFDDLGGVVEESVDVLLRELCAVVGVLDLRNLLRDAGERQVPLALFACLHAN